MKKFIFISAMCVFGMLSATAQVDVWDGSHTTWTQGSGTENDPYLIGSAEQLAHLAYVVNNNIMSGAYTYWKLIVNIDLNGSQTFQWTPIGDYDYAFKGHFNGNGKTISSLFVNSTTLSEVGLFGNVYHGSIKDVGIIGNTSVSSSPISRSGGIVGMGVGITISNCYNTGSVYSTIIANSFSGGIVGCGSDLTIINCYNTGSISSSTSTASSTSNSSSGGIVGDAGSGSTISNCYNTGLVSSSLTSSYSYNSCYASSGGIVGYAYSNLTINNCYNIGIISTTGNNGRNNNGCFFYSSGGIVGFVVSNLTTINNCYNIGYVSSTPNNGLDNRSSSGGIVGATSNLTVKNCYNIGFISSYSSYCTYGSYSGGIAGISSASTTSNYCYYLVTCGSAGLGISKTEESMKTQEFVNLLNSFSNNYYSMDVGSFINNGYPILNTSLNYAENQGAVKTLIPNIVTQTHATFSGFVADTIAAISKGFEYKLASNPSFTKIINTTNNDTITNVMTNLIPNNNYSFRTFAITANDTLYGIIISFRTLPIPVPITTPPATSITQTKATLHGKTAFCDTNIIRGFRYKLLIEQDITEVNVIGTDTNVIYNLTNLLQNRNYEFKTFCRYAGDTIYGSIRTFSTLPIKILTLSTTGITQTKATLKGEVAFSDTNVIKGFAYKLSTEQNFIEVNVAGTDTNIICNLTSLFPNQTYQFKTFCTYPGETIYGYTQQFNTLPITAITLPVTAITRSGATLHGMTDFGDATVIKQGFIINGYDTIALSNSLTTLTYNVTNLAKATTHRYKTFCITAGGIVLGHEQTFSTLAFNQNSGGVNLIENQADLLLLSDIVSNSLGNGHYILAYDIILPANTPNNVLSIGNKNTNKPFAGTFDSNNKRIYNVYIDQPNTPYQGLFGYTKNATIKNLGIIISGRNYTGGLVAYAENTYISSCYVDTGSLFALSYVGGLVGYQTSGTNAIITDCYNTCEVNGNSYVGGLLGFSDKGTMRNSYVGAPVTAKGTAVGALIGGAIDVLYYI